MNNWKKEFDELIDDFQIHQERDGGWVGEACVPLEDIENEIPKFITSLLLKQKKELIEKLKSECIGEEEKIAVDIAKDKAIDAIKNNKIEAGIWGNRRKMDIEFFYPTVDDNINEIEIGLSDVRASDGIKIHYDFERDGYVVMQPYFIDVEKKGYIAEEEHWEEEHWEETGFFQSWALEHKNKELE